MKLHLALLCQVLDLLPDVKGTHLIRYYGWYANKSKGLRAKQDAFDLGLLDGDDEDEDDRRPSRKAARLGWAALIRRVYESDPLSCPKCGSEMKVISLMTAEEQPSVVRKMVDHCGLGRDPPTMASEPTRNDVEAEFEEVKVVPIDEFLASL